MFSINPVIAEPNWIKLAIKIVRDLFKNYRLLIWVPTMRARKLVYNKACELIVCMVTVI